MDERTMTILRNGEPVPSLFFEGLPDEVFVAATVFYDGTSARFVNED